MTTNLPFVHESASVLLHVWDEDHATVSTLWANKTRQGHGSALMQKVVDYADEHGLMLILEARQFDNARAMDNDQLVTFYERFGFTLTNPHSTKRIMMRQSRDIPGV